MSGKSSDIVRDKIRGKSGTPVRLTIERADTRRQETIEIRRGRVPQPSIPDAYILRPGVGYIELSEGFNYTTFDELEAAMRGLREQGMKSLVLDLRGNPGRYRRTSGKSGREISAGGRADPFAEGTFAAR